MSRTGIDVAALRREQFSVTRRWAWFDHATFGPPPRVFVDAVSAFTEAMAAAEVPEGLELFVDAVDRARARAARFINADPDDVAFLKSTAEGLGVVALGLDWAPGDQVIAYDQAFPADVYPWLNLAGRGVEVRLVRDRGRQRHDAHDVAALMTPRTRVVCLELVNCNNGFRAPLREIAALCHERGAWLLVDATQAAGALRIDVREIGCDVLVAHGYKFLMAGWGTAICYFAPHTRERLRVPEPGWKSIQDLRSVTSHFDYRLDYAQEARRFEPGVPDLSSIFGLEAVIDLLERLGPSQVEEQVLRYAAEVGEALEDRGWEIVSSRLAGERSAILSAVREGVDPVAVQAELRRRHVACAVRAGRMRISVHAYNDRADLDRLLDCLPA
ncbi:MAG TPA: aminotransferase class V-fold PLP-dependent enzyme [Candidatus Dormibacteraeota bacterium]|nr:aminotransferase class V-fold PLP-dependent enzyme [Candidatus Dormibacteraeota bacterium]